MSAQVVGDLLVVAGENEVKALDSESGEELWKLPRGVAETPIILPVDLLLVAHANGSIALYQPNASERVSDRRSDENNPEPASG